MIFLPPSEPAGTGCAQGAVVELDEGEQRAEREDVALAADLARLVEALAVEYLDAAEVDAVLVARGAVLALARHVLAAATAPAPTGGGPVVPASLAALLALVATHPDAPSVGPSLPARSDRARQWAALTRSAQDCLARRTGFALDAAARWGQIGHGAHLAGLLTTLDERLLVEVKAQPTVELATVRALSSAQASALSQAARSVQDSLPAHER